VRIASSARRWTTRNGNERLQNAKREQRTLVQSRSRNLLFITTTVVQYARKSIQRKVVSRIVCSGVNDAKSGIVAVAIVRKICSIMLISKIVSGGQTGVDRGALEAAYELGFPYGGLIPKGRLAEDGIVPEKFDQMEVAFRKDYLFRTEWNVTHSDATLIISNYCTEPGKDRETLTGGTLRTERFCISHSMPHLVLFTQNVQRVVEWLRGLNKENIVLNVAGPRESKATGIQEKTRTFITRLIEEVKKLEPTKEPK